MTQFEDIEIVAGQTNREMLAEKARLLKPPTQAELRDELQRLVLADLIGPADGDEEEVSDRSVRDRYLVGMLAPRRQQVQPEEQDDLATDGASSAEEGPAEHAVPAAPTMFPSSFGMSFCVDAAATGLVVTARWGQYERGDSETLTTGTLGAPKRVWKRTPHSGTLPMSLVDGKIAPVAPDPTEPEVVVKGRIRLRPEGWIVTLFLVNTKEEPKQNRDSAWLFQPELEVAAPDGSAIFQRRMQPPHTGKHDAVTYMESQGLNMIYRDHVEFAVGHGVSTHAEKSPDDPTCAVRISTSVVPQYEVPRTSAPPIAGVPESAFDMKVLSEVTPADLPAILLPLADAYERWIAVQTAGIDTEVSGLANFEAPARKAMQDCTVALNL